MSKVIKRINTVSTIFANNFKLHNIYLKKDAGRLVQVKAYGVSLRSLLK